MIERDEEASDLAGHAAIGRRTMLAALAGMACSPRTWAAADHGFEVVHDFALKEAFLPAGSLVQTPDGRLHGTSRVGGRKRSGSVFRGTPGGRLRVVASFSQTGELGWDTYAPLCLGPDGRLYGSNRYGGSSQLGTLFAVDAAGQATLVHSFAGSDGSYPMTAPLSASDGSLYGVTESGGQYGHGVLYRLTPDGVFTAMRSVESATASARLAEAADGYLYTVTEYGGQTGNGSILRFARDGSSEEEVHFFGWKDPDGMVPSTPLLPMPDGSLVGTARLGGDGPGPLGQGTIFRLGTDGALTVLHHFTGKPHDGASPSGGVISDAAGRLYGVTQEGGLGAGTVYRLNPDGTLKLLHRFVEDDYVNGFWPSGELLLAQDGRLYGTTDSGGGIYRLRTGG
ncbi:choice-of-anchor tandem repeat GloVer-containing protein [Ideonella sp. YS5]|uniref:choice-of-anchor tandem repeat GloVer-containing protein n=1 Tax=Ideonella sp. YS5 TaxID=3453714 RepID=UPI003EEBC19A